jgi:Flp pilus assembly protein TadD
LSKEGDLPGAIGELLRALALQPRRSDIRHNLAIAYTQSGQYELAELALRKALPLSPDSVEARVALGVLLLQNKDDVGAAQEFRRGTRIIFRLMGALGTWAGCASALTL